MTGENADVAVVQVNYHGQALIEECIASVGAACARRLAWVVVDNSLSPDTDRLAARHPDLVVIRPGANLGFAGGCNRGIRWALDRGFRYILLLNPDTRAEQDFLEPLVRALEDHPQLGVVGPRILDGERRTLWQGAGRMAWWRGGPRFDWDRDAEESVRPVPVPFVSGCAMLLRSSAIREVGPMDDSYFLYFEDTDYCQRLLRRGWQVAYVPQATLLHAPSSTIGHQSETYVYHFARNRIRFMRRWSPRGSWVAFLALTALLKLPAAMVWFGLVRRQPELASAFWQGWRDGMAEAPFRWKRGARFLHRASPQVSERRVDEAAKPPIHRAP